MPFVISFRSQKKVKVIRTMIMVLKYFEPAIAAEQF